MFRQILQSISRSFSSSKNVKGAPERRASEGSVLEKVVKGGGGVLGGAGAGGEKTSAAAKPALSAEALCGIPRKCGKPEVAARLKLLYRRYNRGASSLDAGMRAESEQMLDAIVEVREKYFGEI